MRQWRSQHSTVQHQRPELENMEPEPVNRQTAKKWASGYRADLRKLAKNEFSKATY